MRQPKLGMFGALRPVGADSSNSETLQRLAGLTSQVGDLAFNIGAEKAEKRGRLAGLQSVESEGGQTKPIELKEEGLSISNKAFNQGAILAHRAAIQLDAKNTLDELQQLEAKDPERFALRAGAYKEGLLSGMPEELQVLVRNDIENSIVSRKSSLDNEFFKRISEENKATASAGLESAKDDMLNAVRKGDLQRVEQLSVTLEASLSEAIEAEFLTPTQAEAVREDIRERSTEQAALGDIERTVFSDELSLEEKVDKGLGLLDGLRKGDLKDLSAEQRDSLLNIVGVKVSALQAELQREQSQMSLDLQREISTLEVVVNTGQGDPKKLGELIEGYFNRREITPEKRTSLLTKLGNSLKQDRQDFIDFKSVAMKMTGERQDIVLDKSVIDKYYDHVITEAIARDPEKKSAIQADYIEKMRAVPVGIKKEIENAVLSRNPELIKQAAEVVDRIDHIPGLQELALTASNRAFVEQVVSLSANLSPEMAIDAALKSTDPADKARIDARREEIKTEKMETGGKFSIGGGYVGVVEDEFNSFWTGDKLEKNINLEQMTKEYKEIFESHFIAGTTKDRAKEIALNALKANWKDSDFGFMRNPPEDYYSVAGDISYVRKQLRDDINQSWAGFDFEADKLFLISDDKTSREASTGEPSYKVLILDKQGTLSKLPTRWTPDKEKQIKKQEKINEAQAQLIRTKGSPKAFTPEAAIKARGLLDAVQKGQ